MTAMRSAGLDAVRAMAILSVCASHALGVLFPGTCIGLAAFLGGGGVQAFFALSGFLIGGILIRVAERASIAGWSRFLVRRWFRTLPTFYAVLMILAVMSWPGMDVFSRVATLTHTLVSDPATEWFAVSWSLAIEEAFYLLFATIFLILARLMGAGRAIWPCVGLFLLGPLGIRTVLFYTGVEAGTQGALLNLDGIACGVALAAAYGTHGILLDRFASALGMVGAVLLYAAWHSYLLPDGIPAWMPWTPTLGALGFTFLLVPALRMQELGILRRPVLVVSATSYPLYLVHLNSLYLVQGLRDWGQPAMLVAWIAATTLIVVVLHYCIEIPVMRRRPSQVSGSMTTITGK